MIIKKIRYQNFRQFGERGEVSFDTNGKITIIYGTNGDGKTTLHQLFQWILYNRVVFNKTTSNNKLYNLARGQRLSEGCSLVVWGEIEFEHEGTDYCVRRECSYYKQNGGNIIHQSDDDEFYIQKRYENNNWKKIESPEALIEEVLPPGLAPYFFFDGETMIADLKIRGTDSAKVLRKALYSIFELEAYEKAIEDIGNGSSTVLGHLKSMRDQAELKSATEKEHQTFLKEINLLNRRIEATEEEKKNKEYEYEQLKRDLQEISEKIGTNKSKKYLEDVRKKLKDSKVRENDFIKHEMLRFGEEIENNYSYLLISEVVKTADCRLYMQVQDEEKKIIPGLTKELLINLLKHSDTQECLCGRCIGNREKENLEIWKSFFPPASYKATYDKFALKAKKYSGNYDGDKLFEYLRNILQHRKNMGEIDKQIADIDDSLRNCGDVDSLIEDRCKIENKMKALEKEIEENRRQLQHDNHQVTIRERKKNNYENASEEVIRYQKKITFMEEVASEIRTQMSTEVKEYSSMLQNEIQELIEHMLTSKRTVNLSEDFQLQVMDSYSDESKSEGQFAVVSFAYIGGIFKVLKCHDKLKGKEYPLVLDGPFSKLADDHKENVIKTIPQYAPQVIIFSKDLLDKYIEEDEVGKVWTIISNDEKNDAQIKEGKLWN